MMGFLFLPRGPTDGFGSSEKLFFSLPQAVAWPRWRSALPAVPSA